MGGRSSARSCRFSQILAPLIFATMPELPDVETYVACLRRVVEGQVLQKIRVVSPFVLGTVDPPIESLEGKRLMSSGRLGKRIWLGFESDLYLIVHLMIAGRLVWKGSGSKPPGRITLVTFEFERGRLVLTEAGKQKRASIYLANGHDELHRHDAGGVEPVGLSAEALTSLLRRENHTVKRSLCDPHLIAGIGNAYSDEILHAARLSPLKLTSRLTDEEIGRLQAAIQRILIHWRDKLIERFADRFPGPGDITAFRPEFAVHGRFGKPCPVCGTKVQRIRYADNETNYCPRCQTDGKLLADRSLSRLLREDWPRSIDELER